MSRSLILALSCLLFVRTAQPYRSRRARRKARLKIGAASLPITPFGQDRELGRDDH